MSSETLNDQQTVLVEQKEAELKEMQDQIEAYNQMVKQLASQREMAVKKLTDMDTQIQELSKMLEEERVYVENKDKELKSKRTLLQTLKNEENELTEKFNLHKSQLDATAKNLANTRLDEASVNTKLEELQQFLIKTNAAIDDIDKAISIKDTIKLSALCNQTLTPPPLSINALLTNGVKQNSATSPISAGTPSNKLSSNLNNNNSNDNKDSLFDSSATYDPFANDDPFNGDDPFKSEEANLALPDDDPFNPASASSGGFPIVQNDPFAPQTSTFGGF